jgi:hypothetical protein
VRFSLASLILLVAPHTAWASAPDLAAWLSVMPACALRTTQTTVVPRPPEAACLAGGVDVRFGRDRDHDGLVSDAEAERTVTLCQGRYAEELAALRQNEPCLYFELTAALALDAELWRTLRPEHRPQPQQDERTASWASSAAR